MTIRLGRLPFNVDLGEQYQTRMFYGFYEPHEVSFVRRTLRPGQIFADVGANVGYYTAIGASAVGPTGEVHSFEPMSSVYDRLQRFSEQAQKLGYHIWTNSVALSDAEDETRLWISQRNIAASTIVPDAIGWGKEGLSVSVRCIRMDQYFGAEGRMPPHMVKIDVEGAELLVLDGMTGLFEAGSRPVLLCEVSHQTVEEVQTRLSEFGYRAFHCTARGLTPIVLPLPFSIMTLVFAPDSAPIG